MGPKTYEFYVFSVFSTLLETPPFPDASIHVDWNLVWILSDNKCNFFCLSVFKKTSESKKMS